MQQYFLQNNLAHHNLSSGSEAEDSKKKMSPIFTSDMEEFTLISEEVEKDQKREKFLDFIVGFSPCLLCVGCKLNKGDENKV